MKQAMIFAAGLGTRLRPLTDTMPKALVRLEGQPLLWHVLQRLRQAGFQRIVVNVHHFAQQIIDYLAANDNFGLDLRISDESDALLDTGGGIRKALPLLDEHSPVLIHNVDIMSNADLSALYQSALTSDADAVLLVSPRQTKRYLLFSPDEMQLRGWINIETGETRGLPPSALHLPPSTFLRLAFSGIHVIAPSAFPLLRAMPPRFGIIDFYLAHCRDAHFLGVQQSGLQLLDVGKIDQLRELEMRNEK